MVSKLNVKPILMGIVLLSVVISSLFFWNFLKQQGGKVSKDYIPPDDAKIIKLFYAQSDTTEFVEKKIQIYKELDLQAQLKSIVEKMRTSAYVSKKILWWPQTLQVRSVYKRKNNLLILDFEKGVQYNHPIGALEEMQLIRSLVKTILANYNEFQEIKILVSGQGEASLAGHVDIMRTFNLTNIE